MQPHLSVVIPCFNEEQNIRLGALDKVAGYLNKQKYSWEVLIADDGSTDQSVVLIKKFVADNRSFRLLSQKHQGKAGTLVSGMLEAAGDFILFSDLDQATPLDQIEKLWPWFEKDYQIAIGSRLSHRAGAPLTRRLMGRGFMVIRNLILGLGISDTQCGFKMFKKEVTRPIFERLVLFKQQKNVSGARVTAGFDVELLFIARKLGYKIREVPVEWHYVDTRRVSPFWDSLDALFDIVRIRLNNLSGLYNFKMNT
jgi:glycosyltransferase involved in cell wall biosynthesis